MSDHDCPGPGCTEAIPRSRLACRRHWFQVPVELRNEVNRTWRRFDNDPMAYLHAREAAVAAMTL